MRWNHFGTSLLFAALAALGLPAARLVFDPWLGPLVTTHLYLLGSAGLYALSIAPTLRRGIGAGSLVVFVGMWLMLADCSTGELAIGLAAGLGVARSVLFVRASPARGLAIELALAFGGLWLASGFVGGGLLGLSLALWSYFLTQSVYFLLSHASVCVGAPAGDAFEQARGRIENLLRESRR